jgi:hypothetical protein
MFGLYRDHIYPASVDASKAFGSSNLPPSLEVPRVHLRIHLTATFHKIKRSHNCMSDTLRWSAQPYTITGAKKAGHSSSDI